VAPMLVAKSRTSRFSHVTASGGYSCPAPGADMVTIGLKGVYYLCSFIAGKITILERAIDVE
jgi:hypothetical protein